MYWKYVSKTKICKRHTLCKKVNYYWSRALRILDCMHKSRPLSCHLSSDLTQYQNPTITYLSLIFCSLIVVWGLKFWGLELGVWGRAFQLMGFWAYVVRVLGFGLIISAFDNKPGKGNFFPDACVNILYLRLRIHV